MIKANELRIGNWVKVPHGFAQIEKFINNGVHFTDGCGAAFEALTPIPLTPEIFEKYGFEAKEYHWRKENLTIWYDNTNAAGIVGNFRADINHKWVLLKYLHQLQNLHFALYAEELQVNL